MISCVEETETIQQSLLDAILKNLVNPQKVKWFIPIVEILSQKILWHTGWHNT